MLIISLPLQFDRLVFHMAYSLKSLQILKLTDYGHATHFFVDSGVVTKRVVAAKLVIASLSCRFLSVVAISFLLAFSKADL